MQPGQIGPRSLRWIALTSATLLLAACQANGALDRTAATSPSTKAKSAAQPAAPMLSTDPAAFIGIDDVALSNALGKPKQVRKDAPAEIWQYFGADCVVDFYLYDSEGSLKVAYMEARNPAADAVSADRCVKSLMQTVSIQEPQKTL